MLFRLSVIFVFLALPVVISLLSQQMANTVAAPVLPTSSLEVHLLNEKKRPARKEADSREESNGQDAPEIYTPRNLERVIVPEVQQGAEGEGKKARDKQADSAKNNSQR